VKQRKSKRTGKIDDMDLFGVALATGSGPRTETGFANVLACALINHLLGVHLAP
jgi:hypothetical protein